MSYIPQFSGCTKILYGPPGTGKTHRLLDILEEELIMVPPDQILYASFTREGARQGIRRACTRFGYTFKDFPYFRTLHSLAFHALELSKDSVMQGFHYRTFGQDIGMNFAGHYDDELHSPDDEYLFIYDLLRNNREYAEKVFLEADIDIALFRFITLKLTEYKTTMKVMDYTDMIVGFIKENKPLPIKVAFIDEAQDLTTLQWKMAEVALRDVERVYIAGDDDQAIYSWSGADVHAFLGITGDKEILKVSHRLPPAVLDLAKGIAKNISFRIDKDYKPVKTEGCVEYVTELEDANLDYPGSYMILVRNRKYIAKVEEHLRLQGYLYSTRKGPSVKRAEITTIEAWETWRRTAYNMSPADELRVKQALTCDIHEAVNASWTEVFIGWKPDRIAYIERMLNKHPELATMDPLIHVATIHTVKGGEADNVILYMGMSGLTHKSFLQDSDAEHRVFYVGATRAGKRLIIVYGNEPSSYHLGDI